MGAVKFDACIGADPALDQVVPQICLHLSDFVPMST